MEPSPYGSTYAQDQPSGEPPAGPGAGARPRKAGARIGLVVLTAVLTELVLIGAAANQWASREMLKQSGQVRFYLAGWLTYGWRVNAVHGQTKAWAAQLALVGTVLVLTAALVWTLLRGPVTWGRAFFGTWTAVLFATVVGAIVRGLIGPFAHVQRLGGNRVTDALFGLAGPNAGPVFGGLVLGLVVGLVTGLVAVVSRRPAVVVPPEAAGPPAFADYAPPPPTVHAAPPPWQDQHYGPPAGPSFARQRADEEAGAATTALPRLPEEGTGERPSRPAEPEQPAAPPRGGQPDQPTTQLPPVAPPRAEQPDQPTTQLPPVAPPPAQQPPAEHATTRFPRPPDDEELGHVDDH